MNEIKRIHIAIVALILAVAAVAGTVAALRTTHVGASARTSRLTDAQIARRNKQLAKIERALRAQAKAISKPAAAPSQPVVYVRPKPIVHVLHHSGEHESEAEGGGGD
jgi:hypothetical protein